jgi:hypothetical protein
MANEMNYELLNKVMIERGYEATRNADTIKDYQDNHIHHIRPLESVLKDIYATMNLPKEKYIYHSGSYSAYYEHSAPTLVAEPKSQDDASAYTAFYFLLTYYGEIDDDGKEEKESMRRELRLTDEGLNPVRIMPIPFGRLTQKVMLEKVRELYEEAKAEVRNHNEDEKKAMRDELYERAYDEHYYEPMRELGAPRNEILPEEAVKEIWKALEKKKADGYRDSRFVGKAVADWNAKRRPVVAPVVAPDVVPNGA